MAKYIEVIIKKPIYGTMCYIRDIYINQARKQNIPLKITIPQGVAVYTAEEWMDGAQRMEKVFLRPDQPMILYGRNVKISPPSFLEEFEEKKEDKQLSLF